MHQRQPNKIQIHKETLRILAAAQLATVVGREPQSSETDQCVTGASGLPECVSVVICVDPG
jgi:hypothetical protein